ncbi:hypothetical protein GCM10011376_28880 [Nocardioides flavus (ex Wang et al. 2016)]|uniref:Uncharacterized protein n=1 Tax=Nocardioides flavus (ex Wang et al. 2016) TaxID=2058780 RepID=A0ABQ3HKS1_9ACTN|nr:hypothetical protein [Nocardioides flavus (ex Wang et al. 2016)]GHE18278.1 hypothetical protein GCM10011376_28880 [Nocardioides flavus (ex Wang et al. 2016)]
MTPPASEPGAPDPALTDPMLRVLREQHPEVDIVVLPQTAPAPQVPELTPSQRLALAGELDSALDGVLERIAASPAAGAVRRDAAWHTDEWDQTWWEAYTVVGPLGEGDNMTLLRATAEALVGLGWQVRPVPGDRPRLVGRHRGGLSASATVRPDSLVLTLRTVKVRAVDEAAS